MRTTTKTVTELIETKESPLPLEVIPNNMGINLCSVDALTWTRQEDGQLVSLTIHFVPAPNGQAHAEQNKRKNKMKKLMMGAAVLAAVGMVAGCFTSATAYTEKTNPDGTKTVSRVSVIGTGDKASQVAAEGLFADGTQDDLGAGVKTASATQQSSGVDGTINALGSLMSIMAQFMANGQQYRVGVGTPAASTMTDSSTDSVSAPAQRTTSVVLSGKVAEAKAANKTLIVVAGNPACSYCTKFNEAVAASTLSTRSDIIFVSESAPWAENSALDWTGGGNAPIVRITRWNADGSIMCDQKLNRPSIAEIEAAITACVAK